MAKKVKDLQKKQVNEGIELKDEALEKVIGGIDIASAYRSQQKKPPRIH